MLTIILARGSVLNYADVCMFTSCSPGPAVNCQVDVAKNYICLPLNAAEKLPPQLLLTTALAVQLMPAVYSPRYGEIATATISSV
jgi:hypothetical protein